MMDRRKFLGHIASAGLGACMGGLIPGLIRWTDRGVGLKTVSRSSLVMGSVIDILAIAETERDGYEAIRRAVGIFRDLDGKLSMYDPDSEMGLLARTAGKEPVPVSGEAVEVLEFARAMWRDTGGRFDVTIEPAMRQWGFRRGPGEQIRPPSDEELKRLEQLIGTDKMVLSSSGDAFLQQEGMAVDLGGIAGGYALDRAIAEMKKADVAAALINFSGDIHCFGRPVDQEGWPVYILDPNTRKPVEEPVILKNEALSTSGSYQNRRHGTTGTSWGHLILPGTSRPVQSNGSVTAIHSSAMRADAWSTAGFVGADRPDDIRWVVLRG